MNSKTIPVRLAIQQVELKCLFDLTWGDGQKLSALIPFPLALKTQYQSWFDAYLAFYQSLPLEHGGDELRGRVDHQGNLSYHPLDWQAELVQSEVEFLYQFHQWLRHPNLFEIRAQIAQLARSLETEASGATVDIFLSAQPAIVARFPWEQWELGAEFGARVPLRISRCPSQIKHPITTPPTHQIEGRKFRVLAILGDEHGLDFKGDRDAIESIAPSADVSFVGWQPQANPLHLKQDICNAIADPQGWDLLFFAGHSNEKSLTGGEFIIGPNQVLSLQQLLPALQTAKENGLQLAMFNSCSGMGIATRLLEMGLNQVAVMREPIHNQVAHAFLQRFLFHLSDQKDAQDALHASCQDLKLSQGVTYPSAYCLPSLFRHPSTQPFQFRQIDWRDRLGYLRPQKWEAIALSALLLLSLLPPIQDRLLDFRLLAQALYRETTGQVPKPETVPPLLLVQVDQASYNNAQADQFQTFSRSYLAQIIQRLQDSRATLIGVDYLLNTLDQSQGDASQRLNQVIKRSVQNNQAWFVFSSTTIPGQFDQVVHREIAEPRWSLWGDTTVFKRHLFLPDSLRDCQQRCPMGYLLTLLARAQQAKLALLSEQPQLSNETDVQSELLDIIAQSSHDPSNPAIELKRLSQLHRVGITRFGTVFRQHWFTPILDFSIPKSLIFRSITAQNFLEQSSNQSLSNDIVLIGSGGYANADDNFAQPLAQKFWWRQEDINPKTNQPRWKGDREHFSGVELHGFTIHHLWNRHLIIPVPDILMTLLVALIAKVWIQGHRSSTSKWKLSQWGLVYGLGLMIYAAFCLQMFLSVAVLFPWLFPSCTITAYSLSKLLGKRNVHQL